MSTHRRLATILLALALFPAGAICFAQFPCDPRDFDLDGDGYFSLEGCGSAVDCDDGDPFSWPGAPERCDWRDNDCDGMIDGPACDLPCSTDGTIGEAVPLTQAPQSYLYSEHPFIASSAGQYGVFRYRGYSGSAHFGMVDRFGRRTTPEVLVGPVTSNSRMDASMTWNGSSFGITWSFDFFMLVVSFFGPDATEVAPDIYLVGSEPLDHPFIIASGTDFALVWEQLVKEEELPWRNEIRFVRFSPNGVPLAPPLVVHSIEGDSLQESFPAIVVREGGFVAVWREGSIPQFALLDETGEIATGPTPIDTAPACGADEEYSLAAAGSELAIAWSCGQQLWFARLDGDGQLLDVPVASPVAESISRLTSLSWTGTEFRVVYRGGALATPGPYGQRLDSLGEAMGPPVRLSPANSPYTKPQAATTDTQTAVVFLQPQNVTSEVYFARFGCSCSDLDEDGVSTCQDCDDANAATFPGAPQACDGRDNDCRRPLWPDVPADEIDADGDRQRPCGGDCDDAAPEINSTALERCNDFDDDCDGSIDEDGNGVDSDQDGVRNLCDNCRFAQNPSQVDGDDDGHGDPCDNCATVRNPSQTDFNADTEGDDCDLDDGLILVKVPAADRVRWQAESGFTGFNVYRGNLSTLVSLGYYTQEPGSNSLAARFCDAASNPLIDGAVVQAGEVAIYLVTGVAAGQEYGLGQDGFGYERPNDFPCP